MVPNWLSHSRVRRNSKPQVQTLNKAWSLIRGENNFDLHVLALYRRLDPIAVYIFSPFDLPPRADLDLQPVRDLERETSLLIGFRPGSGRDVDRHIFDPGVWNRFSVGPLHDSLNAVFSSRGGRTRSFISTFSPSSMVTIVA